MIVFHYLIGNTDGHIKNFSLLYHADLRSARLAPAYDIVSTVIYDTHSTQMAFSIGGVSEWRELNRACFSDAVKELGLNEVLFMKRYDDMCAAFASALSDSAEELEQQGYTNAAETAGKILAARNTV